MTKEALPLPHLPEAERFIYEGIPCWNNQQVLIKTDLVLVKAAGTMVLEEND